MLALDSHECVSMTQPQFGLHGVPKQPVFLAAASFMRKVLAALLRQWYCLAVLPCLSAQSLVPCADRSSQSWSSNSSRTARKTLNCGSASTGKSDPEHLGKAHWVS